MIHSDSLGLVEKHLSELACINECFNDGTMPVDVLERSFVVVASGKKIMLQFSVDRVIMSVNVNKQRNAKVWGFVGRRNIIFNMLSEVSLSNSLYLFALSL